MVSSLFRREPPGLPVPRPFRFALNASCLSDGIAFAQSSSFKFASIRQRQSSMPGSHFETSTNPTTPVVGKLTALISDLRKTVRLLEIDIEAEETHADVFDVHSADYSILARNLRARRDNLLATIAMLETASLVARPIREVAWTFGS
jgi:hypothetical protein